MQALGSPNFQQPARARVACRQGTSGPARRASSSPVSTKRHSHYEQVFYQNHGEMSTNECSYRIWIPTSAALGLK